MYSGTTAADATGGKAASDGDTDSPMYLDPYLPPYPHLKVFHPDLKGLWVQALVRPDIETRRRTIETIGAAHQQGMPGLADLAEPMIAQLAEPTQHPIVRKALIKALGRLDARHSADVILQRNQQDGVETILMSDPILGRWRHEPAYELWIARLTDPDQPRAVRISALQALRTARHRAVQHHLQTIAGDQQTDPAMRLEAAKALGDLVRDGLEPMVQQHADGAVIDRLVGVSVIRHHSGQAAIDLLMKFAVDGEPSVAAVALGRLLEIDPLLIQPIGDELLKRRDHSVRRLTAMGVAAQKTPHAIEVLGPLLNDLNPELRAYVRRQLIAQDQLPHLTAAVRTAAMKVLQHDDWRGLDEVDWTQQVHRQWRGLEQAAMVLGAVDHEPVADELVDLLAYPRWEVRHAAAAALRRLEVGRTLAPMLRYATRVTDWAFDPEGYPADDPYIALGIDVPRTLDVQVAQLMQAFEAMDYREAELLMRRHIPKPALGVPGPGEQARAAAVYAMGHFYAGSGDEELARTFAARLSDLNPFNPERTPVRRLSAVAIGRIGAMGALGAVQYFHEVEQLNHEIGGACRWAIAQLTGEQLPLPPPQLRPQAGWFLESTRKVERQEYLKALGGEMN